MTHVTSYKNVQLSRREHEHNPYGRHFNSLKRTAISKKVMSDVGLCIAQGGHVEMKTYQDTDDGSERADVTLYWKEHPHVTLKRRGRSVDRADN